MKIFYDLGTHLFEGLKEFDSQFHFDKNWKIYCFEANPHTYRRAKAKLETDTWLKDLDIEFHNVAVSDTDGETELECYYDTVVNDYTDVGSNTSTLRHDYFKGIFADIYHQMGDSYCQTEKVPTICFSEFLDKHTSYGDEVYIKMDIEGSEFVTLTRMIQQNTHTLVKQMYIEWHERFWPNEQEKYLNWKNNLMAKLLNDRVDAKIWW